MLRFPATKVFYMWTRKLKMVSTILSRIAAAIVKKLNILSKSRYNVDLILVVYYISAGQASLLQVQ